MAKTHRNLEAEPKTSSAYIPSHISARHIFGCNGLWRGFAPARASAAAVRSARLPPRRNSGRHPEGSLGRCGLGGPGRRGRGHRRYRTDSPFRPARTGCRAISERRNRPTGGVRAGTGRSAHCFNGVRPGFRQSGSPHSPSLSWSDRPGFPRRRRSDPSGRRRRSGRHDFRAGHSGTLSASDAVSDNV